jgi:hypothetical protein
MHRKNRKGCGARIQGREGIRRAAKMKDVDGLRRPVLCCWPQSHHEPKCPILAGFAGSKIADANTALPNPSVDVTHYCQI